MKKILYAIALVVAGVALWAVPLYGQEGPLMRGPAAERVEQWKKIRMMEVLKLDEETSIRFFNRYNKHQEEMQQVQQQREEVLRRLESLRRLDASDAEYDKTLQDFRATEGKALEARDRFWKELRVILTVKQFASYVVFEGTFNRSLRELMRDTQQQRMEMQRRGR